MKVKDERKKLEELLDKSSDKIMENVPTPNTTLDELPSTSTLGIDFSDLKKQCNKEARIMVNNAIGFILSDKNIKNNKYIKNKLEIDIMSLSGMIYQLKTNEAMQKVMMEEVDKGFMHPRMFEVFGGLSKTIAEINKQLLGTVEAIKLTYKDVKNDIKEIQTEALGASTRDEMGMLKQGDGGVVTMGTKELIKSLRKEPKLEDEDILDVEEI